MKLLKRQKYSQQTSPRLIDPSNFPLGPVAVELFNGGRSMVTTRDFLCLDPEYGIDVFIPEFYTTDLNSSPRMLWWFFAKWEYPEAGLVHDWIYQYPPEGWDRQVCDSVHWRILILSGMPVWKADLVFQALHLGSKKAWDSNRANDGAPVVASTNHGAD